MAISDAEFLRWLKLPDAVREVLYEQEFAYESGGAPATGTMRFSRLGYRTKATDSPASVNYRPALKVCPTVKRAVDPDPLGGFIAVSLGGVEISNADGYFDDLMNRIIDGREGRLYIGAPTWDRADFRLVQKVLAEVVTAPAGMRSLKITVREKRLLLDTDIAGAAVNDERRKPLVFGYVGNAKSVEPVEKDSATLEYYVEGGSNPSIIDVYDDGTSLNDGVVFTFTNASVTVDTGLELLTFGSAHGLEINDVVQFSKILGAGSIGGLSEATQYWVVSAGWTTTAAKLSLTKGGSPIDLTGTSGTYTYEISRARYYVSGGEIKLSGTPAGRLLADVGGSAAAPSDATGSGATGKVLRALLIERGGLTEAQVDRDSFESVVAPVDGLALLSARAVTQRENLRQVIRDLAVVEQVCIGEDNEGVIRAFRIDLSALSGESPGHYLTAAELTEHPSASNSREIVGTVAIKSQKNHVVSSYGELGAAVPVDEKRALAAEYRVLSESTAPSGTSYSANWQSYHLTAVRKEVAGAFASERVILIEMADEILGDLEPHIRTVEVETDLRAYSWRLGACVNLTHPRYGCAAGVNFRLIGHEIDLNRFRCRLTLLARFAPNTTSSTFP